MATTLTPGDIAFSAFQADNSGGGFNGDAFQFVLLVPVTAGTTIYFTDNGYRTDVNAFRTNENMVRWVAQTDLPAGTVITFTAPGGTGAASTAEWTGITPSTGATLTTATLAFAAGGDNITALQNPTFGGADALTGTAIAALTFGGTTFAPTFTAASGNATTALAPGLTDGVNAVSLAATDNGRYNDAAAGSVESGTQAVVRASLNNDAYWTTSTTPLSPHNTTATFVISGVVIPTVTIAAPDNTAAEAGQESGTFRISRTGSTTSALTVSYTIAAGAGQATSDDYTPTLTGTAEIPAGASFVDVTITPVDDAAVEGAETVTLSLTDTADYNLGTDTSATVTIADNDAVASEPIDLSTYVRIGRYNLPEPTRTAAPAGSGLAQEVSAVTYNPTTDTLFVIGDEGTSIVQVTKTGQLIDSMTLTAGDFDDPEGLTFVGGNQFVLIEERERQASLFTYVPGGTLSSADVQTVKLGTTVGNIGLEGISYDPQTGGYVLVKETSPQGIFQTGIDFGAGTATNGSPTTANSTNLFDPALLGLTDIADVYALSNLPGALTDDNLLVLSQEDGRIVNVDRTGTITSALQIASDPGNPLTVAGQGFEGVTMDSNGLLYITSEQGGGDSDHPQLWVYAPASYVYSNAAPVAISLSNAVTSLAENSDTTNPIKVGNIIISDDALGTNNLSLTGADAAAFEIVGTELFLKAGTALDFETKPSFAITINVDDPALGSSPDASTTLTLDIADTTDTPAALIISEVAPWSSGNSPGVGADWFEVTNTSGTAIDITGWRIDDDSASFASSSALSGVTSIAPGQSAVFVDGDANTVNAFVNTWFGGALPSGVAIGTYGGPGLGTGGDAVNLFDASGALVTGITFGASPSASPFASFDNAAGLSSVSNLSAIGVNGAFSVIDVGANAAAVLIGSPGTTSVAPVPLTTQVAIAATDAAAAEAGQNPGTFTILRTGDTTNPLTVVYGFAVEAGQATSDDYTPTLTGNVEIPAGASSVDLTITPVDDPVPEGTETLTLVLFDEPGYDVAANASSATVTIADNDTAIANFNLQVTEIWSGNSTGANLTADWFEITNTGTQAWVAGVAPDLYYDDDSQSPAEADLISGIAQIDPGESVIVVIGSAADAATFASVWGSVIDLTGVDIGYTAGAGLGGGGDAVSLFVGLPGTGAVPADFEAYPAGSTGRSYDVTLSAFSAAGQNGAVATAPNNNGQAAVGSPGDGAPIVSVPTIAIVATDATAAEAGQESGTFRISRTGDTTNALTVSYTIAAGAGQATSDDYTPTLTGSVEIPAGASFVDVTITPVDDAAIEGAETVTLTLTDTAAYSLGTDSTATVTIADNDTVVPPAQLVPGDVIFNEYASDNNANDNDFFELLVLKDGADLRGLRVSDNELLAANGSFNTNESVFVFGNDAFLSNVAKGTTIAVYTIATGVTTDTVTSPIAGDWSMTLAPGTGVTTSVDGLGGTLNAGLATGGDALYLYLPGADGTSAGTDNQYLDFISYEGDGGAVAPTGFTDLNLPSLADNAYYTGNTAAGNDDAANWVRYDFPSTNPTPGDANPGQDLSGLRQPKIVLNEILASHAGTDNSEFIELFGTPGASLAGLSLIIVESDAIGLGTIDRRIDFTASDVLGENGFFLIGNPAGLATNYGVTPNQTIGNDFLENNSLTAALVKTSSITGTSVTGSEEVVDTVGITDGGTGDSFFFNAPVIGPDGTFFPAGVRRVTDGVDTDTAADWVISDFALGTANTPTPGLSVGVTLTQSGGSTGVTEGGTTDTYTIVLNSQPTADVTITLTPDVQVTTNTTSLVFTTANWNVAQTVTVTAVDDGAIEGNHTGSITHSAASTDAAYNGVTIPAVTASITDNDAAVVITKIHQIQGNATTQLANISGSGAHNDRSPLEGQTVTIQGIVIAVYPQLNGFFLQEENADVDGDATTSEGIFVFTGSAPTVSEGNLVTVTGAVDEFFGMTQIDNDNGNLSVTINNNGNNLNLISPAIIDLPATGDLNDYYEQFEGMKVQFSDKLVVSEYFELARYGQLVLTEGDRPFQYSHTDSTPTAAEYSAFLDSLNRSRIILDDGNNIQNAPLPNGVFPYPQPGGLSTGTQGTNYFRGGDSITGLTGVLHWSFAGQSGTDAWRIRPTQADPISFTVENPRPTTAPDVGGNVKVASFNVLNYFTSIDDGSDTAGPNANQEGRGADSVDELTRQTAKLVQALKGINADVFGLIEMENNGGDLDGGAIKAIVDALNAEVGAGTYSFINTGDVGTDAITVGIIYKVGVVAPKGAAAILNDPAFTDPNGTGEQRNRPAIAQTFEVINPNNPDFGEAFNVVVNHLKSKGSGTGAPGDEDQNDGQGASNDTRTKAAAYLANVWIPSDPTGQGDADWLIIGDLNAYKGETPITTLKNAGYTDLVEQFGGANAYSYVFNGQLGYLDYALANTTLAPQVTGVAEWHINADEVPVFDYNNTVDDGAGEQSFEAEPTGNPLYEANAFRTSDHDPVIIGLNLSSAPSVNGQTATIFVNDNNTVVGNAFQAGQQPYAGALFSNTDGTANPDDVILGTAGNDNIWAGTEGDDLISSGAGDDTIGISAGNSTVNAGADNDFVYTNSPTSGTNSIDLGEGNNGAWLAVGNNTVTAGAGVDTIGIGSGNNTLNLGGGNDFVYAIDGYTAGTNTIDVGEGDNSIYLPTGNNTITAGAGVDTIGIGTGNDVINAGDGNNVIYSLGFVADEVNEITTGTGQDNIWIEGGTNTINSGDGNDTIGIGEGTNIVNTNGGNDLVYTFGTVFGTNTINLGSGSNTAYLQGGTNTVTAGDGNNSIGLGAGNDTVTLGNGSNLIYLITEGGNPSASTPNGNDTITTGSGDDQVYLGAGTNTINVGDGNNTIFVAGGTNTITGGSGNDLFFGGVGNDTFIAGTGNNYLFGDAGSDVFGLVVGGFAQVADFQVGIDKLGLTGGLTAANLTLFQDAANTLVITGGNVIAQLNGIQTTSITPADYQVL